MKVVSGPFLALDTSAAHCAAAFVAGDGQILASRVEEMAKGQAERLLPLLEEVLSDACAAWGDLAALAVGVGPGNFTGVRISVAAARGIALVRQIPAIGVSSFEMLLDPNSPQAEGRVLASLQAPREQLYVQMFHAGEVSAAPQLIDPSMASDLGLDAQVVVRGAKADLLAAPFGAQAQICGLENLITRLAARAHWRFANGDLRGRPSPLYVRPADAAPPSDQPPRILDAD